jgi:hypothetical protein
VSARLLASLLAVLSFVPAPPATAHSLLLESTPAANAVVTPPGRVELRFNNRIERKLSRIRLVDERGARRELSIDGNGSPDRLSAPLATLAPGPYRVEWQVLSTDGHIVSGRYSFRVAP